MIVDVAARTKSPKVLPILNPASPRAHIIVPPPPNPHFHPRRLLSDLDGVDWADSIKEMQRNWIGRSEGASIRFKVAPGEGAAVAAGALAAWVGRAARRGTAVLAPGAAAALLP